VPRLKWFLIGAVSESFYHHRTHIGQQWDRDSVLVCKGDQDLDRIVTDRREPHTFSAQLLDSALQLDQLRFTVRSPIR
jgi:hypothetical protein